MRADFFGVQKTDVMTPIREHYHGTIIGNMGYTKAEGDATIAEGKVDAIAFGVPFLANPDLPARLKADAELNQADSGSFYSPGPKGYTDYPAMAQSNGPNGRWRT